MLFGRSPTFLIGILNIIASYTNCSFSHRSWPDKV